MRGTQGQPGALHQFVVRPQLREPEVARRGDGRDPHRHLCRRGHCARRGADVRLPVPARRPRAGRWRLQVWGTLLAYGYKSAFVACTEVLHSSKADTLWLCQWKWLALMHGVIGEPFCCQQAVTFPACGHGRNLLLHAAQGSCQEGPWTIAFPRVHTNSGVTPPRRCMCGAPNCRGTMDTQPERFRDFGKRVEVFWDGDSVFYRGTVTAYSAATRKHTILYDDNDVERVCLQVRMHATL